MTLLIALLLSVTAFQQPQPNVGVEKSRVQKSGRQQKTDKSQKQNTEEAPKVICNCSPIQAQPSAETNKENTYNPAKDTLYRAYLIATICGVVIALAGIGVLFCQNRHIKRQSEYLAEQINIQKRTARQWLSIPTESWRQHRVEGDAHAIEIEYEIVNPTNIPLWVDLTYCEVNGQTLTSGLATFLIPHSPFSARFIVRIHADQVGKYETGDGLVLNAKLSIFFRDTFDNQWEQTFDNWFLCRFFNNWLVVQESRTQMRRSEVKNIPAPPQGS